MSLKESGYNVTIVAYHDEQVKEEEVVQGISVKRLKLLSKKVGSNPIAILIKFLEFIFKVVFLSKRMGIEIAHVNDLQGLMVGVFLKICKPSIRIVYDSHEWQIDHVPNQSIWKQKVLYIIEKMAINFANKVIVVSDSIADEYVKVYNIDKPYVILNCPYYTKVEKDDIYRSTFNISKNMKIFLYQGALNKGRGIECLIRVFESLSNDSVCIVFMGYGALVSEIKDAALRSNKIYYHDAVRPEIIYQYTSSADVGICLIEDCCLSYRYCLPNKLFEYTMAGLPVLVSALPELERFVTKNKNGLTVDINDSHMILNALDVLSQNSNLIDEMSKNAEKLSSIYHWDEQAKILLDIYNNL
ncbi:glycosyltransferase [Acinetobacter halotolerans]|nr:glycosyltransferase [Acinetobacter halotolerans]